MTSSTTPLGDPEDYPEYPLAVALGSYFLALRIADVQGNDLRKKRMRKVAEKKRELVAETWPDYAHITRKPAAVGAALRALKLETAEARTLLIDLSFSDPFAPYEFHDYNEEDDLEGALKDLAPHVGLSADFVDHLGETRRDATKVHKRRNLALTAAFGIGGAIVLAVGGWMAAPAIAAYLGAGAGLAGAAATAHGLALLGGGTLAAGGFGMAGGMMIVAGTGAVLGGVAGVGGHALFQLGAAGAQSELIKLQVTFKTVLLEGHADTRKAQAVIKGLHTRQQELTRLINQERELNQENAKRVKELEKILVSLERSERWMRDEIA